ncbi:MAG: Na(+)-translocating NADH-quinone reductase subunit A [Paramuribaculum sp.]|nr:Na(+)-translocating NADH-quinone reductase subunit A [Paramuribaculum sp.]
MSTSIHIKRGLDLKLQGAVANSAITGCPAHSAAVEPLDFPGFVPKLTVKEGDNVLIGSPLLCDKNSTNVHITSPMCGKVSKVERGERRRIIRVVVEADKEQSAVAYDTDKARKGNAEAIRMLLQESGLWVMMRQLPYAIVPKADIIPTNVFVSAFNNAPLAPDHDILLSGKEKELTAGAEALGKLTSGKIFYSTRPGSNVPVPGNVEHVEVSGPHPASLPSIQAANLAPISKGESVLLLDAVTLARIGELILTGKVNWQCTVAITGSEVKAPRYINTCAGAKLSTLLDENIKNSDSHRRIIAGNVLTGTNAGSEGYLHYPYEQVTVIPEGDDVAEFMGWASMSPSKMSVNRSFLSALLPGKRFTPDARILGGRRAMIMSEQYDKVLPMDILPEYLIKAILSRDIDKMEQLGIYEVTPADFALCEYVDPSKLELQKIVREGLDYMRKELE